MSVYVEAKEKYGDLYQLDLGPKKITYRLLTWKERKVFFDLINSNVMSDAMIKEAVFVKCVIDKAVVQCMNDLLAGEVLTIAGLILTQSYPSSLKEIEQKLEEKRIEASSLTGQIIAMICQAFPGYTVRKIEELSWDEIMRVFAMAEERLVDTGAIKDYVSLLETKGNSERFNPETDNKALDRFNGAPPPGDHNLHRSRDDP